MRSVVLLFILIALSTWVGFALKQNNNPNAKIAFIIAGILALLFFAGFFKFI